MSTVTATVRRSELRGAARRSLPPAGITVASLAGLLLVWQVVALAGVVRAEYLPGPAAVAAAGLGMLQSGELWENAQPSLVEFAGGFALAIVVGVPLGLLMGWFRTARELCEPFVMMLNALPRVALIPVIAVWLGVGENSKAAVVFIGAVIPIVVNGIAGVREADGILVRAARSFGATDLQLFRKVLLPSAVPSLIAGLRLGVGHAVIGVVLAEMYAAVQGIGWLLQTYGADYEGAQLVFLVVVVALFGYLATAGLEALESRVRAGREG